MSYLSLSLIHQPTQWVWFLNVSGIARQRLEYGLSVMDLKGVMISELQMQKRATRMDSPFSNWESGCVRPPWMAEVQVLSGTKTFRLYSGHPALRPAGHRRAPDVHQVLQEQYRTALAGLLSKWTTWM